MRAFWKKIILDLGMPRFLRLLPPWAGWHFAAAWLEFHSMNSNCDLISLQPVAPESFALASTDIRLASRVWDGAFGESLGSLLETRRVM